MTTARGLASAAAAALSLLMLPSAARADGPPVGFMADGGITAGSIRYAALPAGHGTLMVKLALDGGRVLRSHYFKAVAGVPMVATDGTAGGLSRDGRTLVLGTPRTSYPQRVSTLYVVNTQALRVRRRIVLRGDFSYDAISPDGRTIYLTQVSQNDFTRYAIRAFDTRNWSLLPKPVVDRREPDEAMRGIPYTRVMSPDGRFAYTLYNGGEKPFVHALDTVRRSSACIDLPPLPNSDQFSLRLHRRRLTVLSDGTPIALVNTATRHVSKAAPVRHVAQPSTDDQGGTNLATWLIVAGAAAALAAAGAARARRRRARTTG